MQRKPANTYRLISLVLVILMAWTGHASALLISSASSNADHHAHVHSEEGFGYAEYADHYHAADVADHVHEIPNLTTPFNFTLQTGRTAVAETPFHFIPARPIFLIERPPCFLSLC